MTTFKTYDGAHQGTFLGAAPSGREIHFEALDAIRVQRKDHRALGVANLFLMQQLGA